MIRTLVALLLLWLSPAFAASLEDSLLTPDEAFKFEAEVQDAHTISARWTIADGYYLHRENFEFFIDTPGYKFGELKLPDGETRHDPSFGDTEIYRKSVQILLPISYAADAAKNFSLRARAQGCADAGVCFPPMKRIVSLALPAAAPQEGAGAAGADGRADQNGFSMASPLQGLPGLMKRALPTENEIPDPEQAYRVDAMADGQAVRLHFSIMAGTYLYKNKLGFAVKTPAGLKLGAPQFPPGDFKTDEIFGRQEIYEHDIDILLPVEGQLAPGTEITLAVKLQGCAKVGVCYPPMTREVTAIVSASPVVEPQTGMDAVERTVVSATTSSSDVPEQDFIVRQLRESSVWAAIGLFFVFGLGLAFTPCVFPMVPILSGLIVGHGRHLTPRQSLLLSVVFVLAMAATYAVLGVIAGASGANLQAWFQKPVVLYVFAALFVALALSMFGLYDLQLPASLQTRLSEASNHQKSGSLMGAGLMGFFSAIIVGPCVTPPLVAALLYIGQQGHAWLGGIVLFAMGLGMGTPLLALGASAGHLLPKAGAWMDAVKEVFGVLLLGVALWLLDRVLPLVLMLALAGVLLIVSGIYMGALDHLASEVTGWRRLWKGLGLAAIAYGILLLIGAASGGQGGLLQPLKRDVAGTVSDAAKPGLKFTSIKGLAELNTALADAGRQGKPVMLDFYADWCVSCKELEADTFVDAEVKSALKNVILLRADVTANDEADRELERSLNIPGPPAIMFYDRNGQELKQRRLFGFKPAPEFAGHVRLSFTMRSDG